MQLLKAYSTVKALRPKFINDINSSWNIVFKYYLTDEVSLYLIVEVNTEIFQLYYSNLYNQLLALKLHSQ